MNLNDTTPRPYAAPKTSVVLDPSRPSVAFRAWEIFLKIIVIGVAIVIGMIIAWLTALKLGWVRFEC
jgi:hypothetical protein